MRAMSRSRSSACRRSAAAVLASAALLVGCTGRAADLRQELQLTEVTTGWFDAGIVDGKNKLVPTISLQLRNAGPELISSVQLNAVFRRVGETEEWGSAYTRAIGPDGLAPGGTTRPLVLQSALGYTGEQPRAQMLSHSQFVDARVELFAKHGSAQWLKLGEYDIQRQLLTQQ
jgi:hypothetical protein